MTEQNPQEIETEADVPAREAGVVLHPTSLPGPGPRGTIGADARRFVTWLSEAGFTVWQVLPLGPTHGDLSPYQCQSVLAADPALIDRDDPVREGWLPEPRWDLETGAWLAYARAEHARNGGPPMMGAQTAGVADTDLRIFAQYRAARSRFDGAPWWQWPAGLRNREPRMLDRFVDSARDVIADEMFGQQLFSRQWHALRRHAARAGVRLMGDAPIFVAQDSVEVWAERHLFQLDRSGEPQYVAGVPPDYFSETGQRWGNPLYDWDAMAADNYRWWLKRLEADLSRVDLLRLDHFRGLEAYWAIPAENETAIDGEWRPGPGDAFLSAVSARFGNVPLVAEDLGIITDEVTALRERHNLPGMKVLQFAFGGGASNPYLPHLHTVDSVVYTGTHDNDTTVGWIQSAEPEVVAHACDYFDCIPYGLANAILRAAYLSVARTCMMPMQDLLWLDGEHRMNTPGEPEGNWQWRFTWDMVPAERAAELRALAAISGRLPESTGETEVEHAAGTGARVQSARDLAEFEAV